MGTRQHEKYRMTFSITEEAHERVQKIPGSKSAWVSQLIEGTPISDDRLEIARLNRLEQRLDLVEAAIVGQRSAKLGNVNEQLDG